MVEVIVRKFVDGLHPDAELLTIILGATLDNLQLLLEHDPVNPCGFTYRHDNRLMIASRNHRTDTIKANWQTLFNNSLESASAVS